MKMGLYCGPPTVVSCYVICNTCRLTNVDHAATPGVAFVDLLLWYYVTSGMALVYLLL